MPHDNKRIAIAQISVEKGNIPNNLLKHIEFIRLAGEYEADYIIFPELSLTGYEPQLAKELALNINDANIKKLSTICKDNKINAVIGAPIRTKSGIMIGNLIVLKNGYTTLYTKQYLFPGEESYFVPGNVNPILMDGADTIAFAICADTNHSLHRKNAFDHNASIYMASVMLSLQGYSKDTDILKNMSKEYGITVVMANYCGETGGYEAAGGSSAWDTEGRLIGKLDQVSEGILFIQKEKEHYIFDKSYYLIKGL